MTKLFALNLALAIVLIVGIAHSYRLNWKSRKLQKASEATSRRSVAAAEEAEAINRRAASAAKEAEAINRRSTALLNQADAAWSNSLGWDVGPDDCDQDGEPKSTRNLVDPWAEIHHPDRHQAAAIQPAGLPVNLYQCQCGRQHQRPAPLPEAVWAEGNDVVRGSN